jgi:isopentenyl diphosphate isomerase/L-lactate dehydrogenase-like FMN-dependent dehydrogenase
VFAGLPDPGDTRQKLHEASEPDAAAMHVIIDGLIQMDVRGRGLTIAEIIATLREQISVTSVVVSHDRDLALTISDVGILRNFGWTGAIGMFVSGVIVIVLHALLAQLVDDLQTHLPHGFTDLRGLCDPGLQAFRWHLGFGPELAVCK